MREPLIRAALVVAALAGCVEPVLPGDAVRDERHAVALGQKACRTAEGQVRFSRLTPRNDWHAHFSRGTWDVWYGVRDHGLAFMEVWIAASDGRVMQECIVNN